VVETNKNSVVMKYLKKIIHYSNKFEHNVQMGIQIASAALGFFVYQILAHRYGASLQNDSFTTAYSIIGRAGILLFGIFITAWIPVFITLYHSSSDERNKASSTTAIYSMLVIGMLLSSIIFFSANHIVKFVASDMPAVGQNLTIKLVRLLAPLLFLQSAYSVLGSFLNSRGRYLLLSSTNLIINIGMLCALSLLPIHDIHNVIYGLLLGGIINLFFLMLSCRSELRLLYPSFPTYDKNIKQFGINILPLAAQAFLSIIETSLFRKFANSLGIGFNIILSLAINIRNPFMQAIGQLGVRAYPKLAKNINKHDLLQVRQTISHTLSQTFLYGLPAGCLLFILSRPACYALFCSGQFDSFSTEKTAQALSIYSIGLLPLVLDNHIFQRVLVALGKNTSLLVLNFIYLGLFLISCRLLVGPYGFIGLIISQVIPISIKCILTGIYLWRLKYIEIKIILEQLLNTICLTTIVSFIVWMLSCFLLNDMTIGRAALVFRTISIAFAGIGIFMALPIIMKNNVWRGIRK